MLWREKENFLIWYLFVFWIFFCYYTKLDFSNYVEISHRLFKFDLTYPQMLHVQHLNPFQWLLLKSILCKILCTDVLSRYYEYTYTSAMFGKKCTETEKSFLSLYQLFMTSSCAQIQKVGYMSRSQGCFVQEAANRSAVQCDSAGIQDVTWCFHVARAAPWQRHKLQPQSHWRWQDRFFINRLFSISRVESKTSCSLMRPFWLEELCLPDPDASDKWRLWTMMQPTVKSTALW